MLICTVVYDLEKGKLRTVMKIQEHIAYSIKREAFNPHHHINPPKSPFRNYPYKNDVIGVPSYGRDVPTR